MELIPRVKRLLLSPSTEWPVIDQETHTVKDLYLSYLLPLASIAALATLLGIVLFGYRIGAVAVSSGFGQALGVALMGLVVSMVSVYILGWIITALAPTFHGEKNFVRGFTVAAFSMTGALVGSFANILPVLSWLLGLLGAVYSLYLLYKGLPILMKSPPDKALGYTVVVVIAALICNVILTALLSGLMPNPWRAAGAGLDDPGAEITIRTPGGEVTTTQGKLEEMGRQLEAAARKVEQASQKQDPDAVSKAAGEAVAAITGMAPGGNRTPLSAETLKAWLPGSLDGMKRESFEVQGGTTLGVTGSTARATYRDANRSVDLEVLDAGGAAGIVAMISGLQVGERETETSHEKSYHVGKRKVMEKRWKDGKRAEMTVVLANGVMVTAKAQGMGLPDLDAAVKGIGLEQLEAAQPPATPQKS